MNDITMKLQADRLIRQALEEDISSEDLSTNAVMPGPCPGTVDLIAKEDGVIAGLDVFAAVSSGSRSARAGCSVFVACIRSYTSKKF